MDGTSTRPFSWQLFLEQDQDAMAITLVNGARQLLQWRYRDLLLYQTMAAQMLQLHGAVAGDRIVVVADSSPHFVALLLASMQLRCCFVPVNPDAPVYLLNAIVQELRPRLIIIEYAASLPMLQQARSHGIRLLRLRPLHALWLRRIVLRGSLDSPVSNAITTTAASDTLLLLYSSGSTGLPKAICYTAATLGTFLRWQQLLFAAFPDVPACEPPSARINVLPLAHFAGLSFCLQSLLEGRTVHLLCNFSPDDYVMLAKRSACQLVLMVPSLYEPLLEVHTHFEPTSLRYCVTVGDAISPRLAARVAALPGIRLVCAYGMSEGLSGIGHTVADLRSRLPEGSCGRLLFGEAELRDLSGEFCESEGELFVRNATTNPCYLHSAHNDSRFVNGWYRTGDLMRRDANGFFFYEGRVDDMCVINGRNVYPAEVEAVLRQHPGVVDCLVAPVTLANGKTRMAALVVAVNQSRPSVAALLDHYISSGPLHAVPCSILFGDTIPTNATGKRDRITAARWLQQTVGYCPQQQS